MKRNPFPTDEKGPRPTDLLQRIHSEVVGPITPASLGGNSYFVTFLDEFSNYVTVVPIRNKSDVFGEFKKFQAEVELSTGKKIKEFQSDQGGEFTSKEFEKHFSECGILHMMSVPRAHQQNGRSERQNETLMKVVRCLLIQSGAPKTFWAEAVSTACYLRNLSPSASIAYQIPFEIWHGRELEEADLNRLKTSDVKYGAQFRNQENWGVGRKNVLCSVILKE